MSAIFTLFVVFQLSFEGIKIVSASVNAKQANVVNTFIKDDYLELSHGIEFGTGHKVSVSIEQLSSISNKPENSVW